MAFFSVIGGLAVLASVLLLWQWTVARRFPLHQASAPAVPAPSVSLLKPVHGADPSLERCLESWLRQAHPAAFEVLVGVHRPDDPAVAVVQSVLARHPGVDARLVVCPDRPGLNHKACTLARLEELARHDVVVVSDADVLARPGLLASVVGPLALQGVGLANCLYRNPEPVGGARAWEALSLNVDFWSQVLQSRSLAPQDFALGAVIALRRSDLLAIGGFRGLVDQLADDFHLGRRVYQRGLRIELATMVADCIEAPATAREVWGHQVRWARTIRACRPVPFFLSILSNGSLWAAGALAMALVVGWSPWPWAGLLVVRASVAASLHRRMCPELPIGAGILRVWPKDIASALVWAAAFLGNTVEWRGRRFRVRPGGTLRELA